MKKINELLEGDSKRLLFTVLVVAFIVRLGFVLLMDPGKYYFSDTRHFDNAANSLLDGNGFGEKYNRAPLYPVIMAGVYAVFGNSFLAMRIFEVFISIALIVLLYLIALRIFDKKTAILAAAIAAVFPHFILLPGILYSTNVFALFLAGSVILLLIAEEKNSKLLLLASGLTAGLATLTIPSFFFMFPFWLTWIFFRSQQKIFSRIANVVIFVSIFSITLAPWTIRNYHVYGRFTLVRPIPNTALPNLDDLDAQKKEIESGHQHTTKYLKEHPKGTDEDKLGNMFSHYLKNPWGSIKYVVSELGHFYALYPDRMDTANPKYVAKVNKNDGRQANTFHGKWVFVKYASIAVMLPIFAFALLGLATGKPFERKKLLLLLTILPLSLGYSMILSEVRYRIPVEPYILMFTAAGIVWLGQKIFSVKHVAADLGEFPQNGSLVEIENIPVFSQIDLQEELSNK